MASGIPVVIVESGGIPVVAVEANAPVMTIAENGLGAPITLTDAKHGAPFIIEGLDAQARQLALSSDDGSNLADDDDQIMETY